MPLDPIVKALLDQAAALNMPPFSELTPDQARAMFKETRTPVQALEPVDRIEDRAIPGPAGEIPVRVYAPKSSAPLPALVYYHGGGWVIGDLDTHDGLCRKLSNRARCVVVSVDYRLAPEHKFPAAAEDGYAAAAYVHDHAAEFAIDPARIAVGGDSAGGNIAAVTALMARDRGGPRIAYQLLIYPVTDYSFETASYRDNAEGYFLTTDSMRWFWAHYLPGQAEGANPYASPLRAPSLKGLPPALVITAEFDPLRDEGDAYAARLREAGVVLKHSQYPGMVHGFVGMHDLILQGRAAIDECAAVLREAFAGEPAPA
ncbi:MAG: alpha/beta hydrolase [Chloroflexi bacterium]|nr:alpha/beta hydrolase [Chloroflexota bacterium]